jgi:hypothetical protein
VITLLLSSWASVCQSRHGTGSEWGGGGGVILAWDDYVAEASDVSLKDFPLDRYGEIAPY